MRSDIWYESRGGIRIHGCRWAPAEQPPRAVVQIVHGIAEHVERYDEFAKFLNSRGILVVAEDHMGHGGSICADCPQGYFRGGWHAAANDTYQLTRQTMAEFSELPYIIFGHSMGSFLTRTILAKYPDSGISAAILCGTGWQSAPVLKFGKAAAALVCRSRGEKEPNEFLRALAFSGYNRRVEHPQTPNDWLSRNRESVRAYEADPLCGFTPSAGLMHDMMAGIQYIQDAGNLARMNKSLPVLFVAGGDDPVGNYGAGVRKAAAAFEKAGMRCVKTHIYPLCRHELLNEINRADIYEDIVRWIGESLGMNFEPEMPA